MAWRLLGEHFAPLHSADPPDVLHNSHTNVFAGVAKGSAPASFGEQEEELRDPRGARDWLIWKSHGAHPSSRLSHVSLPDLTSLGDPARHMARRAPPNWFSCCVTRSLPCLQTSARTSEPSKLCQFGVARRHSRGCLEGHPEEEGQGE
jgi:hypothetical protein